LRTRSHEPSTRAALTGKRGQAASAPAAPGAKIVALDAAKFASAYGFSRPERTKSPPVGVERWLGALRRSES
jgi:hypothetical protein